MGRPNKRVARNERVAQSWRAAQQEGVAWSEGFACFRFRKRYVRKEMTGEMYEAAVRGTKRDANADLKFAPAKKLVLRFRDLIQE